MTDTDNPNPNPYDRSGEDLNGALGKSPPDGWPYPSQMIGTGPCAEHDAAWLTGGVHCGTTVRWGWLTLPRHWQLALWGRVQEHGREDICPNAYAAAVCSINDQLRGSTVLGWQSGLVANDRDGSAHRAGQALAAWQTAVTARGEARAGARGSFDPAEATCSRCGGGFTLIRNQFIHHCHRSGAMPVRRSTLEAQLLADVPVSAPGLPPGTTAVAHGSPGVQLTSLADAPTAPWVRGSVVAQVLEKLGSGTRSWLLKDIARMTGLGPEVAARALSVLIHQKLVVRKFNGGPGQDTYRRVAGVDE